MANAQLTGLVNSYLAAYSTQDAEGCARAFTVDGALISPFGPPARGRAAIAATYSDWFTVPEQDKRLDILEFQRQGNMGFCLLAWSARVPDEGRADATRVESGLSLCVLDVRGGEMLFSRLALVPDPA